MEQALQIAVIERVLAMIDRGTPEPIARAGVVPVDRYRSPEWLEGERSTLFRRFPLIVGRESELPSPGSFLTHDFSGTPILALRDKQGVLHAFTNICRHRGARLVDAACGETKGLVCPYHAWAYDLSGKLIHVPQEPLFPGLNPLDHGLVALPIEARHGFLFVQPSPGDPLDVARSLGPFDADFSAFGLATHHLHRRVVMRRRSNWKLVMDAFLEGYHVRALHRDSLYRFFRDDAVVFDFHGPHSRSVGARRTISELPSVPKSTWNVREHTTVFYSIFPNTILVFHPDWLSQITLFPVSTSELTYVHSMLIPKKPASKEEEAHWEKTFDLIEGKVFQTEDLHIAESIQSGMAANTTENFVLGGLEYPMLHFHQAVAEAIEGMKR